MSIFSISAYWMSDAEQRELADKIATRCVSPAKAKVQSRTQSLSLAEARGYIRARATSILRAQAKLVFREFTQPIHRAIRDQITDLAMNQLIEQLVQPVADSPQHVQQIRRAA